jgi:hypothetical protein
MKKFLIQVWNFLYEIGEARAKSRIKFGHY